MAKTTRRRIQLGVAGLALVTAGVLAGVHAVSNASPRDAFAPSHSATESDPTPSAAATAAVDVDIDGFANWALLNRGTGEIAGANLTDTSTPQSMIKPWLIADYLNRSGETDPELLDEASAAIRVSDDVATQSVYQAVGGDASIERLIATCELTDTEVHPGWWSMTRMSARDAARMGECVADGRAAGGWTDWLLAEMRAVEGGTDVSEQHATSGGGRWGIIDGLPKPLRSQVAIKNGWTRMSDGDWDLNCLAVHDDWVLTVMLGYSNDRSLDYGADRCRDVAAQLFGQPGT